MEQYSSASGVTASTSDTPLSRSPQFRERARLLSLRLTGGDQSKSAATTATDAAQVVAVAHTEPVEVEDESAKQLATVGRPEYYGAVEHDDDVASDLDSDVSADDDTDRCYEDVACNGYDISSDVDTDGVSEYESGMSPLTSPLTRISASVEAAATAAAVRHTNISLKQYTNSGSSQIRAPRSIFTSTAEEAAAHETSHLKSHTEVTCGTGKKIAVIEAGTDLVSVTCCFRTL
jgi:hypothetical protein